MGFRDGFIDGYLLTPVGPRQRNFAQWSLENTVDSGLRANQKQLQALRDNITSTFQAGISRLEQSQMQSARLLQRELQYQADNIVDAIDRGSADVVGAVQKACDYLGGQLCEVRWAVERQNQISQQVLQVLLNALDNTSRQYWEQGVKCYETSEYDIARERFNRALDANRTNYFAYQYLGFIAVHEEKSTEALKNFELARKFADSGYHRALALSHLARSHHAVGDLPNALKSAVAASEAAPDHAKFWYERAVFHVRGVNADAAVQSLRAAISCDWTYWSISISDANLEPIRKRVERLLEQMREEQRVIARQHLDHFTATMKTLGGLQITAEIVEAESRLEFCNTSYRTGTVFSYRDLVQPAIDGEKLALEAAGKVLDQRIAANRSALKKVEADRAQEVLPAKERIWKVEKYADKKERSFEPTGFGCVIAIVGGVSLYIYVLSSSTSMSDGPTFILKAVLIGVAIGAAALLFNPVMKYFSAELPASSIRSELPMVRAEYERVKADSESRLSKDRQRLDAERERMKRWKEYCHETAAGLTEGSPIACVLCNGEIDAEKETRRAGDLHFCESCWATLSLSTLPPPIASVEEEEDEDWGEDEDEGAEADTDFAGVQILNCPLCEADIDLEAGELYEGDTFPCEECGASLIVTSISPVELAEVWEEEEEEEDDSANEEGEEESDLAATSPLGDHDCDDEEEEELDQRNNDNLFSNLSYEEIKRIDDGVFGDLDEAEERGHAD